MKNNENSNISCSDNVFIQRFSAINQITESLSESLRLGEIISSNSDFSEIIVNKIGGYNCSLDGIFQNIENSRFKRVLYRAPIIRRFVKNRYIKKEKYELAINHTNVKSNSLTHKKYYDVVLFASLQNYLPILLSFAEANKENKKICFILPMEATTWPDFAALSRLKFDKIYLEDIQAAVDCKDDIQAEVLNRWSVISENFFRNLEYRTVRLDVLLRDVFRDFACNFLPPLLCFNRGLELLNIRFRHGVIARNRRALENSFVEFCRTRSIPTTMIIHGMLSSNYDRSQLFTNNYNNVDEVVVFGEQQKKAIELKQRNLGRVVPRIEINARYFLSATLQSTSRCPPIRFDKRKPILVVGQKNNDNELYNLSLRLTVDLQRLVGQVSFRPHPLNMVQFKGINGGKDLKIEESANLHRTLQNYGLVISHSSTALLQSLALGIPVLFLHYEKFNRKFDSIFHDPDLLSANNCSGLYLSDGLQTKTVIRKLYDDSLYAECLIAHLDTVRDYFLSTKENRVIN